MASKRRRRLARRQQQPKREGPSGLSIQQLIQAQQFSGPLPHPEHLRQYEEILPGAAERILNGFERQSTHRQDLELRVVQANIQAQTRGAWLGFVVALTFLAGSAWLIANGYTLGGSILGGADIGGLVSVFVIGKREQRKEREEKFRTMYGG